MNTGSCFYVALAFHLRVTGIDRRATPSAVKNEIIRYATNAPQLMAFVVDKDAWLESVRAAHAYADETVFAAAARCLRVVLNIHSQRGGVPAVYSCSGEPRATLALALVREHISPLVQRTDANRLTKFPSGYPWLSDVDGHWPDDLGNDTFVAQTRCRHTVVVL